MSTARTTFRQRKEDENEAHTSIVVVAKLIQRLSICIHSLFVSIDSILEKKSAIPLQLLLYVAKGVQQKAKTEAEGKMRSATQCNLLLSNMMHAHKLSRSISMNVYKSSVEEEEETFYLF